MKATAPWTACAPPCCRPSWPCCRTDRKSTRLNSSHSQISYAVFCLKKNIAQELVPREVSDDRSHDPSLIAAVAFLGFLCNVHRRRVPLSAHVPQFSPSPAIAYEPIA